jgi:hypothetical protein
VPDFRGGCGRLFVRTYLGVPDLEVARVMEGFVSSSCLTKWSPWSNGLLQLSIVPHIQGLD